MKQQLQSQTALWHCDACQVWWGSGSNMRDAAALVQYVASTTSPLTWGEYRGWRSMTSIVTCPQCGQPASPFLQTRASLQEEKLTQHKHQPYLEVAL